MNYHLSSDPQSSSLNYLLIITNCLRNIWNLTNEVPVFPSERWSIEMRCRDSNFIKHSPYYRQRFVHLRLSGCNVCFPLLHVFVYVWEELIRLWQGNCITVCDLTADKRPTNGWIREQWRGTSSKCCFLLSHSVFTIMSANSAAWKQLNGLLTGLLTSKHERISPVALKLIWGRRNWLGTHYLSFLTPPPPLLLMLSIHFLFLYEIEQNEFSQLWVFFFFFHWTPWQ